MFDLSSMSLEQLHQLEQAVQREKQARRAQEEENLYREIREKISVLGISADDLLKRLGSGKSAQVKPRLPAQFRDPANPANTWSGRGRKPLWVEAWLREGRSIDDLRI